MTACSYRLRGVGVPVVVDIIVYCHDGGWLVEGMRWSWLRLVVQKAPTDMSELLKEVEVAKYT